MTDHGRGRLAGGRPGLVRHSRPATPTNCGILGEFHRAVRPGGALLLGFHAGDGSRLKTEGYGGYPMKVVVYRRPPARMRGWLREAGFTVEAETLLGPDDAVPGASVFARRS